ncbi:hypothetical protein OH492_08120 [Vibrio chagasii]|nr:hypothetical protein [Vibrio chagasii]
MKVLYQPLSLLMVHNMARKSNCKKRYLNGEVLLTWSYSQPAKHSAETTLSKNQGYGDTFW